ncbi:MAG: DUF4294 domain-containing protein [Rikenellaceae bacterium]
MVIKNKKLYIILILIFTIYSDLSYSQIRNVNQNDIERPIINGKDTIYYIHIPNVLIIGRRRPKVTGDDARLGLAVYVTYGVAKDARVEFEKMNKGILLIGDNRKAKRQYIKAVEEGIVSRYTPTLNRISLYQGKVLLKLIDRELGNTSFQAVKELKGGFSAVFWQGVARIFGANLKSQMSASREDRLINFYAQLYDQGVLYQYLRDRTTAFTPQKQTRKRR